MVGGLGDISRGEVDEQYRKILYAFIDKGQWENAEWIVKRRIRNVKNLSPLEKRRAYYDYKSVREHMDPRVKVKALYSLALALFALGGLMLLGNITGNVVGFADVGSDLFGAILFAVGVVGVLVLSRSM